MGHYRLFWRASRALLHPVTILAIGLSLYNDHWLRVWHPSWLTGKLSDFTWLVFAPLICLMLIVWLVPSRWLRFAPLSAFAFIGLWFATAKTLPFVHGLTTQISGALQGSPSTLLLDPTDLIALPALLVGWWVWTRIPDADPPPIRKPSVVWLVLGLALIATVASDNVRYIDGITRFCRIGDRIVALTNPRSGASEWGRSVGSVGEEGLVAYSTDGLRWTRFRETDDLPRIGLSPCSKPNSYWVSTRNADGEEIRYRWKLGEYIERGNADTETWETIHELNEYDAEVNIRRLINMNSIPPDMPLDVTNVPERAPEPHSGFVDPVTGMVFFAMGVDGGLVYVPDDSGEGVWHWVAIGTFKLKLETIPEILSVLHFESWLALALVLLVITHAHAHAHMRQSERIRWFFLFVGRWSWLIMIVFFLTPYQIEDDYTMGAVALFMFVFVALPLSYRAIREILKYCASEFPVILACGILLACLYLLPYVFWAQGTIFQHQTASIYALILTICGALFVQRYLSERLPMLIPAPNYALRGFTRNYPPDDDVWDDEDDEEDAETSEGA